jgi:tetratricopeptide (TPR) repeat protein
MNAPFAPPKSRNDPCPCGSGKRYKHCHGSETPPADTYVAPDPALDPLERARAAIRAGRHADAVAILDTAQAGEHGDPAALRLLGEALRPIDLARSRTYWQRVLDGAPDDPEAHLLRRRPRPRGWRHRRSDRAFRAGARARARSPGDPEQPRARAREGGRLKDAEAKFRRMLELVPDALNALANLAQNLFQQMRFKEAVPLFDTLIERLPTAPAEIWANPRRGAADVRDASRRRGEPDTCDRARSPSEPGPWRDLGVTRTQQKHYGRAAMALRKAFEIDPTDRVTEGMLLHTYGYEAYWKDFPRLRADVIEAARNPADQTSTHTLIVPFPVPGDQRRPGDRARGRAPLVGVRVPAALADAPAATARRWPAAVGLRVGGPARAPGRAADRRPVRAARPQALRGVRVLDVQGNDRRRAQAHRRRGRRFPAAYEVVDFFEIADAMRDDGIDVAFDLTGFTAGSVTSVLQLRPAPVQINFLGFTGTLASPAIDWMITDPYCVPPDARAAYVERPSTSSRATCRTTRRAGSATTR